MHNIICKNCNKEFQNSKKHQQFCSKGCATSYRQKAHDLNFMEAENEFKYYMLGLIYADGCISKQQNKLERLTLELKDKEFIENIKPLISPHRKLYITRGKKETHSDTYKIICTNVEALNELKRLGVMSRKSKIIQMPLLTDKQFRHFVRGFFDGDGSIFLNHVNNHTYKHLSFTIASKEFALELQYKLKQLGFSFTLVNDSRETSCAIYVKLYKQKEITKFAEWMYKDSEWYIQRKYDRFYDDIV